MNIDWDRIEGQQTRAAPMQGMPSMSDAGMSPTMMDCTDEEMQAACEKIMALPAIDPADPDEVATFWPVVTKFTLADIDFGNGVTVETVQLADLFASNPDLSREKLLDHVEECGAPVGESVMDAYPWIFQSAKKQTIIDGHHRLAACMLLGATTWPCYIVPR